MVLVQAYIISIFYLLYIKIFRPVTFEYLFDKHWYKNQIVDEKLVIKNKYYLFYHFMHHGYKKGYCPHPLFDIRYYTNTYRKDLIENENPIIHFLKKGCDPKFRPSNMFNSVFYAEQYQIPDNINPLIHFLKYGRKKGFSPNHIFYKTKNIEPELSHDYFRPTNIHNYVLFERSNKIKLFREIFVHHIKADPDYILILSEKLTDRFNSYIKMHCDHLVKKDKKVLVINCGCSFVQDIVSDHKDLSYVNLSKSNIIVDKEDIQELIKDICIQLQPKAIHLFMNKSGKELIYKYYKQISFLSKIFISIEDDRLDEEDIESIGYINYIFTKNSSIQNNSADPAIKEKLIVYPSLNKTTGISNKQFDDIISIFYTKT